jgi:hypothetical protein
MKKLFVFVLTMMLFSSITLFASDFGAKAANKADNLTLSEMLTYAIQDEYLARSEYAQIIEKYGPIRPFSNIIKAEERHISYLIPLFEGYGYDVPKDTSDKYIVIPQDIKTALELGVDAEIENIEMYESFLKNDLPEDVQDIFERLKAASENHLRAFRHALGRY